MSTAEIALGGALESKKMVLGTTTHVVMPRMGDSVSEGTILEWKKAEGDHVSADETLVEISTDKVDAEVPAPVSGTLVRIHAAEGETVTVGALLAEIAADDGARRAPAARRRSPRRAPATAARPRVPTARRQRRAPRRAPAGRSSTSSRPPPASR